MATIRELAEQLSEALVTDTRNDGTKFIKRKDGSPQWMQDVIFKAHQDKLPDDHTYEAIDRILSHILDCTDKTATRDDMQEALYEIEADVYTSDLTEWLHSDCSNVYYLDEVMKEGSPEDGFQLLAMAQHRWLEEIGNVLVDALDQLATEEETETEEATA